LGNPIVFAARSDNRIDCGGQEPLGCKKRAAHDFIQVLWSASVREAEETLRELVANDRLLSVLDAKTSDETKSRLRVQTYLNHYELLAGSIRRNILDENVCKAIIIDDVLYAEESARPLIDELRRRTDDDGFYAELNWLSSRWRDDPDVHDDANWLRAALKEIGKL